MDRVLQLQELVPDDDSFHADDAQLRPDPSKCLYRYTFTAKGGDVRKWWSLPESAMKHLDVSLDGCKKLRTKIFGHKSRCGTFFSFCEFVLSFVTPILGTTNDNVDVVLKGMDHGHCVGWHSVPYGEGHRDALVPVYRLKPKPPEVVFMDYACGCEEFSLNHMPRYFSGTQFYHDVFHGYAHQCPPRFDSRRVEATSGYNTSLMEQFNSYLQPLRGLLKAWTTRVSMCELIF